MSAFSDDPDHFQRWSGVHRGGVLPPPRLRTLLQEVFADAVADVTGRRCVTCARRRRAAGAGRRRGRAHARRAARRSPATRVVLATGLETPLQPRLPATRWPATRGSSLDPWAAGALDAIRDGDTVAIIGTQPDGDRRRGLDPQRASPGDGHRAVAPRRPAAVARGPVATPTPEPAFTVEEFLAFDSAVGRRIARLRTVRRRLAAGHGLVAADRPGAVDGDERRPAARVPRRLPQRWEIHRHRIAAEIARDLDAWIAGGRLAVHAAAIRRGRARPEPASGSARTATVRSRRPCGTADRIIVAIGPNPDATANPLLGAANRGRLVAAGVRWGSRSTSIRRPAACSTRAASRRCPRTRWARCARACCGRRSRCPEIRDQAARRRPPAPGRSGARVTRPRRGLSARRSGSRAAAGRGAGTAR